MDGLYIGNSAVGIETVEQKDAALKLLGRGPLGEVMIQSISADQLFSVEPGDPQTMEFFYILEGVISSEIDTVKYKLSSGDYFYVSNLLDTVYFQSLTDVKLLYISNEPIFGHLSEEIRKFFEIVSSIQQKDFYTLEHSRRVRDLSVQVGKRLGFTKERLITLYYASLLHDVGKINTPEEILNKPAQLTKAEFDIIKRHPEDGMSLLKDLFDPNIAPIVFQHHERLDGSGYPLGLTANSIRLEAKIIGVVDTFDAMTADRPYRKGLPTQVALEEIERYKGILYDPAVVEAFVSLIRASAFEQTHTS